jgi:tyrosine aminotransferase
MLNNIFKFYSTSWKLTCSESVTNTTNELRNILQFDTTKKNPNKSIISLSIGDPTIFGNLPVPPEIHSSLIEVLKDTKFDGYGHSAGFLY